MCFKCGAFSLTKEKRHFFSHFLEISYFIYEFFLLKWLFLFENTFEIFFYKKGCLCCERGTFGPFWGRILWMVLETFFGERLLRRVFWDFWTDFWKKILDKNVSVIFLDPKKQKFLWVFSCFSLCQKLVFSQKAMAWSYSIPF